MFMADRVKIFHATVWHILPKGYVRYHSLPNHFAKGLYGQRACAACRGSHEVRGSIPLGSTNNFKFAHWLQSCLFKAKYHDSSVCSDG
jgi:hypothetical protein